MMNITTEGPCSPIECTEVLILGAGIAGLAAAQVLRSQGISCIVLEARQRTGGRIHSVTLPPNTNQPTAMVDLGANYLHGCVNKQSVQPLFRMAQLLDMECAVTLGDLLKSYRGWDNPQMAIWRDLGPSSEREGTTPLKGKRNESTRNKSSERTPTAPARSAIVQSSVSSSYGPNSRYRQRFPRRCAPLGFAADGRVLTRRHSEDSLISRALNTAKESVLEERGQLLSGDIVMEMVFLLDRCIVTLLTLNQLDEGRRELNPRTLDEQFKRALDMSLELLHDAGKRDTKYLTRQENGVLSSLRAKFLCYVRAAVDLPCTHPQGIDYQRYAQQGYAYRTDFPQPHHYQAYTNSMQAKLTAFIAQRDATSKKNTRTSENIGREAIGEKGLSMQIQSSGEDRLVLSGFQQITDHLSRNVDIRLGHVVRLVQWQKTCPTHVKNDSRTKFNNSLDPQINVVNAYNSSVMVTVEVENQLKYEPNEKCSRLSGSSRMDRCIRHFHARYCLITLPVGVLRGLHEHSRVNFSPTLPKAKVDAIQRLAPSGFGQPTHDKVLMQFRVSQDLFWDINWPQINTTDPRVHLLNLHVYGKKGVLLAHLWADAGWSLIDKTDEQIIEELMSLLERMYPSQTSTRGGRLPRPIHYIVTRWSEDPFSLGSYTEGGIQSRGDEDREAYRASLPNEENPEVLFAGEATVLSTEVGQQCTHGAFLSGIQRAIQIIRHFVGSCRLSRDRLVDHLMESCQPSGSAASDFFSQARESMMRKRLLHSLQVSHTMRHRSGRGHSIVITSTTIDNEMTHNESKDDTSIEKHDGVHKRRRRRRRRRLSTSVFVTNESDRYPSSSSSSLSYLGICRRKRVCREPSPSDSTKQPMYINHAHITCGQSIKIILRRVVKNPNSNLRCQSSTSGEYSNESLLQSCSSFPSLCSTEAV